MEPGSTGPFGGGELVITDRRWRAHVPNVVRLVARALAVAECTANVALTDDRTVKRLNYRDRGKNKPTNVLTYDPPAPGLPGEIILALGTIRREAASAGRRPAHHMAHLVVHGALHLAGHDHHRAGEARRMEMAETRILHRLGVPNPWRRT